ncbi:hypothetical protein BC830DRAFT_444206 [Chytriomyces sp. MP71]|nr:hypothetical protein BC830DRAFT_444206 [Chytriomyces sp. MP71]
MQAAGDQDGDFDTVAYGAESGQSAFLTSTASLSHFLDEGVEHMPFESPAKDSVQGMTPSEEYLFNFMKESGLPQKSQYTNLHSLDYLPPGVSGANDFLDDFPSGDGKRVSIDNHFYDEELRYSTSNDVSASIARAEDATSYNSLLHGYGDESAASSSHYLPAHAAIAPLGPNNRVQFISKRSPAESRSRVSFSNDSTELGAHVNGNTTTRIAPEHLAVIPKPAQSPPVIEPQQLMTFRSATVSEIVRSDAAEIQSARGSTIRATLKRQSTVPGLKQDDSGVLGLSLANERPSMAQPLEVIPSRQSMAQKQGIASVRQLTEKEIATPRQSIVKKPESASVRQSMVQKPGSAPVQQSMVYNPESASVRQSMVQKPESAPVRQSMVQKPGTTSSIESTVQKPETGSDRQSMAKNPEHLSARQSEVQQRLASAGPTMTRRQSVVHRFDEDVLSHKEALISEARSLQTPEIAAPKTQTHPQTRIETACYQPNLSFAALRASIGSRATPPTALSAASVDMQARARDVMRELLTGKDAFTFHHCKFEYRGPVRVEQEPLVVGAARVPVSVAGGERTIRTNGSSQTDASNLDSVLGRLSRMSVPSPKARSGENDSIDLGPDLTMSDLSAPNAKDNSGWGSFLASRGGSTRALGTSSQSWIREDQNRDEHSAHEASETKDGEDDGDTDENERPAPKQFRRTQPEARFSQFSKRTRDPISFRPTERILRKRANELDMVNAELVHLSRVLADKKDQLKRREDALDIREHQIAEAQERLELDVQDLVRERTVERDECLKREIEALIQSSDASIASLAKENRRLVVSNKEMAGANRRLRDQSRLFMAAINERDVREFELHNQIKQVRSHIAESSRSLFSQAKRPDRKVEKEPRQP